MIDLRTKRILVTGGDGFCGSVVLRQLREKGVSEENLIVPRRQEFDLRIREDCERITKDIDVVIHLAATTGDIEFHRKNPAVVFYDNLVMGVELLEAARKAGVEKVVVIGSVAEYPANAPLPFRESDLWKGIPETAHIPYAIAKKMLAVQGAAYREQYDFSVIHLLIANMYGPREPQERGFVIPTLIHRIGEAHRTREEVIEVWGTGNQTRDFIYVEDAARGIILATEKYDAPEPVNVGSGREISIRELTELIARLMEFTGEIRFNASRPEGQVRRAVDTTRAEEAFGFHATTDLESGLREVIHSRNLPQHS